MINYWEAEAAQTIAEGLIAKDERFKHIHQLHPKVIYLFYNGISIKSVLEVSSSIK